MLTKVEATNHFEALADIIRQYCSDHGLRITSFKSAVYNMSDKFGIAVSILKYQEIGELPNVEKSVLLAGKAPAGTFVWKFWEPAERYYLAIILDVDRSRGRYLFEWFDDEESGKSWATYSTFHLVHPTLGIEAKPQV